MKNIKKVSLLVLLGMLASCNNTNSTSNSTKASNNTPSTSNNTSINDPDKKAPIYDGNDVLVSEIVKDNYGHHIKVNGKDFLFMGSQIRVDAFMNCDKLSCDEVELLFKEASKLGVTVVQIPIEWAKLEIEQDQFDYTFLWHMLTFANRYNLKIELLWFGTNMCGDSHSYTVPDYILRDGKTYPKFDALRTGEYWNYYGVMWFLDFDNENLMNRESNAITKMMDYIYDFDSTHEGKKPVIGVQVLNEPDIFVRFRISQQNVLSRVTGIKMTSEEGYEKICNSLDKLGKTVKNSKYKVYTRVNFANSTGADQLSSGNGIYDGNNVKNAPEFVTKIHNLEGIDIVGDDSYNSSVKNIKGLASMFATKITNNFGHIAENDGNYSNTPSLILAAMSQHAGYSIYDLITSPFFVKNGSSSVDQGVMTFKENSFSEFNYKAHYASTKNIINGLKEVSGVIYNVSNEDFACFNIKSDYPSENISQNINTTNASITFNTSKSAIGYAIDTGNTIDIYVTNDSEVTLGNININDISIGHYIDNEFNKVEEVSKNNKIALKANILYHITYSGTTKLTSSTWDNIGG